VVRSSARPIFDTPYGIRRYGFHARARIPDPPGRRQTRSIRLPGRAESVSADQPLKAGETKPAVH